MRIGILCFPGFSEFETVLCAFYLREQEIISLSLDEEMIESLERQKFHVDECIGVADPDSFDLLVVPGGDSSKYFENEQLKVFFTRALKSGCRIAAICGGSKLIASLGLLGGKKCTGDTTGISRRNASYKYYDKSEIVDANVVLDGNIITGQGQAFIQFAVEVARLMGILNSDEDVSKEVKWLMNVRNETSEEQPRV